MTSRVDTCRGCGGRFEQELRQGRPHAYCETCRPRKTTPKQRRPRKTTPKQRRQPAAAGPRADPPVRADGRCVVCLKPRKISAATRRYAGVQVDFDPFCSSRCCRKWHGVAISGDDGEFEAQEAGGQRVQAERRALAGIEEEAA